MKLADVMRIFKLDTGVPALGTGRGFFAGKGDETASISPLDERPLASFHHASREQAEEVVQAARQAFHIWRGVPAPVRAQVLLDLAGAFREKKEPLAHLMTYEMGKPVREARIEIEDCAITATYAAGFARKIGGMEAPSIRPDVQLMEKWHPAGPVLIITAFNFPASLWAWNACLAVLCGDSTVWKPAPQTPLMTVAVLRIVAETLAGHPEVPEGVFSFIMGTNEDVAVPLVGDKRLPVVSATGSIGMGRAVGKAVAERLGTAILELGGNAAALFTPSADMDLSLRHAFFAATMNGGQRCTALRRLLVHESRWDGVVGRLKTAYKSLPVGDVFGENHTLSPLVDRKAAEGFEGKVRELKSAGVEMFTPGTALPDDGTYVPPCMSLLEKDAPQPQEETFGPLLYVQPYSTFDEAIEKHNAVPQGLASGIYTNDVAEMQRFVSERGSDAGLVAVNDITGNLEVALAFGGTKDSGVLSEKGGDSWKHYMRRQSIVVNYSGQALPAAGVSFGS